VDADEDQHDVEDQDKMSRRKKQQHLSHHIQSFHTPVRAAKQAVAKDPQDVNKDRLAELEAPPDKAMCLQIFGEMLGLSSWKVYHFDMYITYLSYHDTSLSDTLRYVMISGICDIHMYIRYTYTHIHIHITYP